MAEKEIVVFRKKRLEHPASVDLGVEYHVQKWKPGVFRFLPPNKGYKYILYWIFHYAKIFKNRNYSAYFIYNKADELVSSCLVVPSHFKWPFMNRNDVQFTYVMTRPEFKGQGMAGKLIHKVIELSEPEVANFWYVTDTDNTASIKVAEKMGFERVGKADRVGVYKQLKFKV